jgi:N-acetyl-1-D-myo-inositol-2-amino-2-deoxy-alpha-D-glucopyranoside deacetylase
MAQPHTLMTVHAHPDDETISTGGVMARYSRAGDRVICVTCTGGEHGEIVVPEMDTPENHAKLGQIRAEELRRALARLGPIESRKLGYVDSGMMGTAENAAAESFWQADVDEAAGRLVAIVRETRPEVIVGYNDYGGYGHPDHIRAGQVARLAFARAGDPAWYPEQLAGGRLSPWQPRKLYETVFDMSRREEMAKVLAERGVENRWNPPEDESEEQKAEREAQWGRMQAATGPKTTSVNVSEVIDDKLAALKEHVTQIAPSFFFVAFTADEWRQFQPNEDFTLRVSYAAPVRIPETDLFAGLDEG